MAVLRLTVQLTPVFGLSAILPPLYSNSLQFEGRGEDSETRGQGFFIDPRRMRDKEHRA